ncbi:MAG TPA: GIY-YIG nuclease family protein [Candidatus Nitrosocosmicus sp.]|nr:GIY-YIG nuclease family protein [Candidatus Nitrosocosmicus sp.]
MYNTYAIYNQRHKKIYIGQTDNIELRIELHNNGKFKNSYTSRFTGNWILIYNEKFETRKEALLREKQLKSYQGRQFIKKHIPL